MKGILYTLLIIVMCSSQAFALDEDASANDLSIEKLRRIKEQVQSGDEKESPSEKAVSADHEAGQMGRSIQGLLLCFGALFVGVYFLKRSKGGKALTGASRLRLEERLLVGPKTHIALISVDGKEMLVGVSETQVTLLRENSAAKIRRPIPLEKSHAVKAAS